MVNHKDRQICLPSHKSTHCQNHHRHNNNGFHQSSADRMREPFSLNCNLGQNQQRNWQRSKEVDRMQPFFLVSSGRTTSGTGVFLPTTAFRPPTKRPACSPVLCPERVVQGLNLNVHNHGINISPRPGIGENESKKNSEKVITPMNNEVDQTSIDSLEKLLPEEWIY